MLDKLVTLGQLSYHGSGYMPLREAVRNAVDAWRTQTALNGISIDLVSNRKLFEKVSILVYRENSYEAGNSKGWNDRFYVPLSFLTNSDNWRVQNTIAATLVQFQQYCNETDPELSADIKIPQIEVRR